ncbi:MAG: zf-HC2 domain-containing protein [Elusimicrobiales bacterium]|nr:zf-HC2 domain-containing protein [Elusimicrobiales bacterium]
MNGPDCTEKAVLHHYGELSAPQAEEFRLHLASCPHCREILAALSAVKAARASLRPPETVIERVRAAVLGKQRAFETLLEILRPALLAASAAMLLIALNISGPMSRQSRQAAEAAFETRFAEAADAAASLSAALASGGGIIEDFDYGTSVLEHSRSQMDKSLEEKKL